jgi:calcium-dependent protein kinase
MLIQSNADRKIQDIYCMDKKQLGEGTYGSVCRGTHKVSRDVRAIKKISKGRMRNLNRLKQEINIMKTMDHPNIVKLFETFEDQGFIYLVMELCCGGELFERILEAGRFTEADAAAVMLHIFRGIFYMHEQGVCHRDLKPENFLFATKDDPIEHNILKIIDFGLSCYIEDGQQAFTKAGTPFYVAPEVLTGCYDKSCDLWSAGIIMYTLLCGYPPFYGRNDGEVLTKVRQGAYTFDKKEWANISDQAKKLITNLLKVDPGERYSAEEALHDEWVFAQVPQKQVSLKQGFVDKLSNFRKKSKFKKAALQFIAGALSEAQISKLRGAFISLDSNGDGLVTIDELKYGLENAGVQPLPPDVQEIMDGVDTTGSGVIDYTEFLAATLDRKSYLQEDVCWTTFTVFDRDGDGRISTEELHKVLCEGGAGTGGLVTMQEALEIMREADKDGDGSIDFDEFMEMMRGPLDTRSMSMLTFGTQKTPGRSPRSCAAGGA